MSSEQFENDEVSMVDVLAEDRELEEEANAVFGDSDDQNCTYDKVLGEVYEEVLLKFVPIVVFIICTQGYDCDIGVR